MKKGTIIIVCLLLLIGAMLWAIIAPRRKATSINSAGKEIPVAANESNIQTARGAMAWDAAQYGTIYYYYIDGRPESAGIPGTSDLVSMPKVTEAEAILAVQGSLKKGTYRIIALRTLQGEELTTCPYVVNGQIRDNAFG